MNPRISSLMSGDYTYVFSRNEGDRHVEGRNNKTGKHVVRIAKEGESLSGTFAAVADEIGELLGIQESAYRAGYLAGMWDEKFKQEKGPLAAAEKVSDEDLAHLFGFEKYPKIYAPIIRRALYTLGEL